MELDEPIDYSTAAYRLAKSVNDYFAGWEPPPEYFSAAEFEEFRQKERELQHTVYAPYSGNAH